MAHRAEDHATFQRNAACAASSESLMPESWQRIDRGQLAQLAYRPIHHRAGYGIVQQPHGPLADHEERLHPTGDIFSSIRRGMVVMYTLAYGCAYR